VRGGSHGQRISDRGLFFPHVRHWQVHAITSRIQGRCGIEEEPTVTKAVTVATRFFDCLTK